MIGSILMCDQCGASVEVGARPCTSGSATRHVNARGTIRRYKLGRMHRPGSSRPGKLYSVDLCERCHVLGVIADQRLAKAQWAAHVGMEWQDA